MKAQKGASKAIWVAVTWGSFSSPMGHMLVLCHYGKYGKCRVLSDITGGRG